MKQNNTLKTTAVALVMLFAAANENNAQGNKPGGFEPVAPAKTEVNADSVAAVKSDTLKAEFKAYKTDADTGTQKKTSTHDMPLDDQAAIYSRNNDAIGIAIFVGKDMEKYTHEQIKEKFEKYCSDRGVKAKVFIGAGYSENGNTVYAVYVNSHSVGGIMSGKELFDKENGLPFAINAQKGYDNRRRRAGMSLDQ
jgi:hypothetical protein